MALPMVFTGIRIAVVNAIGTAVFAAFVGGGGLGASIYQGIRTENMRLILLPTAALMVIAFLFDTVMGQFEKRLGRGGRIRRFLIPVALAVCAAVTVSAVRFGGGPQSGTLVLYDGDYSETKLLVEITKQLVEDRTDLTVTVKDQMSQVNNFNELKGSAPSCDLMPSYDGTLLTTFLHQDISDVPAGMSMFDYVNQQAEERYGLRLLDKLGLNNTYAIAVPESVAQRYQLTRISDLLPVANQLVFGAEHEFFTQEGGMKYGPFIEFYGLAFKDAVSVDIGLKYTAAANGSFDVTEVYTTDGLNRKAHLQVLEDDRHFFPEYNGALLVREDLFQRFSDQAPNLEETLQLLGGRFTNETMTDLTYAVDVEGRSVEAVAREFLVNSGLLSK
jgi:osmoprotectant transport system permease protein